MINLSKKIYVGWNTSTSELPEANIIPLGESPQEKKRLDKFVLNNLVLAEHDNVPLPGFTLYNVSKKHYGSSDSSWLVIDPRGFLCRITQQNLAAILYVTGITEGLIQQQCVWVRDNDCATMSLIPVSAPEYIEAVQNTKLLEGKVDIADVAIGDTVLLRNKLQGTYLGVHSLYCSMYKGTSTGKFKAQSMLRRQVIEISPGRFHYQADAKILKVIAKSNVVITRDAAAAHINQSIKDNLSTYFTSYSRMTGYYYGSTGKVKFVSVHAVAEVQINLVEIDALSATALYYECVNNTDLGSLIVENAAGDQFTIDFPWWGGAASIPKNEFYINKITEIGASYITRDLSKGQYYAYRDTPNFVKYYKIVKCVKNDTYI